MSPAVKARLTPFLEIEQRIRRVTAGGFRGNPVK